MWAEFDAMISPTRRKSSRWLHAAAEKKIAAEQRRAKVETATYFNDGALLLVRGSRPRSVYTSLRLQGPVRQGDTVHEIRMGPNAVHAFITYPDGDTKDLGVSYNLLTNTGRDLFHQWMGGVIPPGGSGSPATAVSNTSITATGAPWTASNLSMSLLGLVGFRVYVPTVNLNTPPVYGNVVANSISVATVDQWWTATDGVGATPGLTNAFIIGAGGISSVRFMGLTTDSAAASYTDTILPQEITSGGCGRALATYGHVMGAATCTIQKVFVVTATFTAIHKMGLFCCLTAAGPDPVIFETVLNADATVANGDTLTVTDTITISG